MPTPLSVSPTARAADDGIACGVGINGVLTGCASVQADETVWLLDRPVAHQTTVLWTTFGTRAASLVLEDNRCNHRTFS